MKKMYLSILKMALPIFVIWLFMLAMANNYDLHDIRINLYASIKRFENITSDDFNSYITTVVNFFSNINFNTDFNYVAITDLASFFQNVGIWFNGVWSLIGSFFQLIGSCIGTIGLGIAYIGRLVINIFMFVFNPVQL